MSRADLDKLIDHASAFCDRTFAIQGEIAPMWHAVNSRGEHKIMLHPVELGKDLAAAMIRAWLELEDAVRYIYMGEAWTIDQRTQNEALQAEIMAMARAGKLHEHPDRLEIVQIQGEDHEVGQILVQRRIIRPRNRKPYLGPLEMVVEPGDGVQSEGRMIGMLPARGTRQ